MKWVNTFVSAFGAKNRWESVCFRTGSDGEGWDIVNTGLIRIG